MRPPFYLFLLLALTSCSKRVLVRFKERPPEVHSSESLAQVMLVNKSPKIVLRVPETDKGLGSTDNKYQRDIRKPLAPRNGTRIDDKLLYNAIEKQLFRENFSVKDRGLFNEVLDKAVSVDYSKVSGLTNTDLILEWVNMDRQVGYNTNQCYRIGKRGREKAIKLPADFRRYGASIDFKLVYVKTNEVVGNYKFYYSPCTEGCEYEYKGGRLTPIVGRARIGAYESVDQSELEVFMTDATRKLVELMR